MHSKTELPNYIKLGSWGTWSLNTSLIQSLPKKEGKVRNKVNWLRLDVFANMAACVNNALAHWRHKASWIGYTTCHSYKKVTQLCNIVTAHNIMIVIDEDTFGWDSMIQRDQWCIVRESCPSWSPNWMHPHGLVIHQRIYADAYTIWLPSHFWIHCHSRYTLAWL